MSSAADAAWRVASVCIWRDDGAHPQGHCVAPQKDVYETYSVSLFGRVAVAWGSEPHSTLPRA